MLKNILCIKPAASIGLMLIICLFMSCSEDESVNLPTRPNSENTGFPKGMQLKDWTGSDYINSSDLTYDGYNFPEVASGYYTFAGNNVVLRNCKIQSGVLFSGDNIKIEHSEVIGGISLSGTATAIISYNDIHSAEDDAIHITSDNGRVSNVTVSNNFIHSFTPACGAHADGMQVRGVDKLTITNNAIDMGVWRQVCNLNALNSAIFLQDANGGNKDITIDGNYLNGAGYVLYIGIGPNTNITNNRFGRDEEFGIINNTSNNGDIVRSSGNVRDDNNEVININP